MCIILLSSFIHEGACSAMSDNSPYVIYPFSQNRSRLIFGAQMNADWKVDKAQHAEFNVPTCGTIAVWQLCKEQSLCGTVMMAWIWHVWINAIVFVPAAKAPPKARAKELSYNCLNLANSGQHPCFGPNWFIQFCHIYGDEYGVPGKALPRKQANVDTGHQIRPRVISPRANERTS